MSSADISRCYLMKATAVAPDLDFDEWFDYGMRALASGFFER